MSRYAPLLFGTLFAFLTDQFSKYYVVYVMNAPERGNIPVIPPFLNFRYLENRGINFGLLGGDGDASRWILTILSFTVILVVLYFVRPRVEYKRFAVAAGLLIGGALGNVYDRIVHGYVVDFLNNSLPNWNNPYSYNLADVWIFVGIIGMLIWEPKKP